MNNFKPNENFKYYMYWLTERMNIFWNRYEGKEQPYTNDPILQKHKFTNVYRSLDRVSQYLIKNVIYDDVQKNNDWMSEDIFWRILIFKHFNNIETWELLEGKFGKLHCEISFDELSKFLNSYHKDHPEFVPYSNAYMLTAAFLAGENGKYVHLKGNGWKKYQYYFHIFDKEIFHNGYIYTLLGSKSLEELYNNFMKVTSFASFLSMQLSIDMNYSTLFNFDENSFIQAGLGAQRGLERVFDFTGKKPDYNGAIMWIHENFEQLLEDYKCDFMPLPNRMPTLIDLQNICCESDKYLRGNQIITEGKEINGKRIKNFFTENKQKIDYCFPPKWNVKL